MTTITSFPFWNSTSTSTVTNIQSYTGGTGGPSTYITTIGGAATSPVSYLANFLDLNIGLPDGARLIIDLTGNYRIEDKNAKITYKANRVREFNTFLNASDRVEDFIRYCKDFDISQREMVDLPIRLFIMWLILEAANADQVPPEIEDIKKLQLEFKRKRHPRCKCGRFIRRAQATQGFLFCNGDHYNKYRRNLLDS